MVKSFEDCLKTNDIEELRALKKGDLHNHIARGGNINSLKKHFNVSNINKPVKYLSFDKMESWYKSNIGCYFNEYTYPLRIKWALEQLSLDGITMAVLTFGYQELKLFDSVSDFICWQTKMFNEYAPNTEIIPEIGINSNCSLENLKDELKLIFKFDFFKSIDIHGKEIINPEKYIDIYKLAKKNGLKLRAHIGEFSDPELINKTIDVLELEEINHGNRAVESVTLLKKIKKKGIRLNLCPESNLQLNLYEDLNAHPIRKLFDFGIIVTINTDDMLIFDKSLSQLYIDLFNNNIFSSKELEKIRMDSLWF